MAKKPLTYQREPDGKWRVFFKDMREMKTANAFYSLLGSFKKTGRTSVLLDFSKQKGSIYPGPTIAIAAACDFYSSNHGFDFAYEKGERKTYLAKIVIDHPLTVSQNEEDIKKTIFNRVIRFDSPEEAAFLADQIIDQLRGSVCCEKGVLAGLGWCISEIVDNVFLHSSANHGFLMAQIHNKKKIVNVSILDTGTGLFKTLSNSSVVVPKDEMDAIRLAIQKGVTEDKEKGQGNGLYGLHNILRENKGHFTLATGHCEIEFNFEAGKSTEKSGIPVVGPSNLGTRVDFAVNYLNRTDVYAALDHYEPLERINRSIEEIQNEYGYIVYDIKREANGDVGSRESGKRMRISLLNIAKCDPSPILLDLSNVEIISSSFADELFAKLIEEVGFAQFASRFRIVGANEFVNAMIDRAIRIRQKDN